jgi:hypothetical protein
MPQLTVETWRFENASKIKIERAAGPRFVHLYKLNQTWNGEKAKIEQ